MDNMNNAAENQEHPLDALILHHNTLVLKIQNALLEKAKESVDLGDYESAKQLILSTGFITLIS